MTRIIIAILLISTPGFLLAASGIKKEHWTTGLYFGAHEPRIVDISRGLRQTPLIGWGNVKEVVPDGEDISSRYDFRVNSGLSTKSLGVKSGFNLAWDANPRHSLIFSIGTWENSVYASQTTELPIQDQLTQTHIARKSNTSYTEYSLGWKFNFLRYKSFKMFSHLSVHEVFDIDYKEDLVFTLDYNQATPYKRAIIVEAQTASLLLTGIALGAEYTTRENFNLNISGGYLFGRATSGLKHLDIKNDFLDSDGIRYEALPFATDPDTGDLFYLPHEASATSIVNDNLNGVSPYKKLDFTLEGWQVLFQMSMTF